MAGAGGHKGMQSLIVAFQSEEFRRVKIGVGRPSSDEELLQYVLTPFTAAPTRNDRQSLPHCGKPRSGNGEELQ